MLRARRLQLLVGAMLLAGLGLAAGRSWLCDDAFISMRYAQHLVRGQGLVFNVGERVEGFTNLLWTLWLALGMALGANPETWAVASGLACHAGTLVVVFLLARRLERTGPPVALLLAVASPDLAVWASGGLETALVTVTTTLTILLVVSGRAAAAGAVAALATLTRPDAALVAAVAGAGVVWLAPPGARRRAGLRFAGAFLVLVGPATAWRVAYYGQLLPNTYYAKGAYQAWWSQGFAYLGLSAVRAWPLVLGIPLVIVAIARRHERRRELIVLLAAVVVHVLYVARVGGGTSCSPGCSFRSSPCSPLPSRWGRRRSPRDARP